MRSLRTALHDVGFSGPFSWRTSITGPRPRRLTELIVACRRPRMNEWTNPERAYAENQDWTEELNGLVTDGHAWYASCNADDDREGLYKLTMGFDRIAKLDQPFDVDNVHIGALAVRAGKVFVPMQFGRWGCGSST